MAEQADGDEMASVKNYFETVGAERWKKIYGETDVCALLSTPSSAQKPCGSFFEQLPTKTRYCHTGEVNRFTLAEMFNSNNICMYY